MNNASDFIIENGVLKKYEGLDETVEIPEGITEIGARAFAWKHNLKSVTIPDSVSVIGLQAFQGCEQLKALELPKGLKILEDMCFANCKLQQVRFPDGLEKIGKSAFRLNALNDVRIPASVTEIGDGAFFNNVNLENLVIPGSVRSLGEEAFAYCYSLESLTIEPGVEQIGTGCFRSSRIQVLHLPESVKETGENAFHKCDWLKEFSAPGVPMSDLPDAKVKSLAMADFIAHPEQYTNPDVVASCHNYLFIQKKKWLPVIFREDHIQLLTLFGDAKKITPANFEEEFLNPATAANATQCLAYLLDWKGNRKPTKKTALGALNKDPYSVTDMKKLWLYHPLEDGTLEITCYKGAETEVHIPPRIGKATVSRLGERAFSPARDRRSYAQGAQMQKITSITVPSTVTAIDPTCIAGCTGLESLVVEEGNPVYHSDGNCWIHTAEKILIAGCKTSVIPKDGSVTAIGEKAFLESWLLSALELPPTIRQLGSYAFSYCTHLQEIAIPAGVEKIPQYCFDHCQSLTKLLIPDSVTELETCSIYACLKIKEIHVPASVTKIGSYVFSKATIYGASGSYAETYAQENSKKFVAE